MKLVELFEKTESVEFYDLVKHKLKDNGEYALAEIVDSKLSKADATAKKAEIGAELNKAGYIARVVPHKSAPVEK